MSDTETVEPGGGEFLTEVTRRRVFYLLVGIVLLLIAALTYDIVLWNQSRNDRAKLGNLIAARKTDKEIDARAQYAQCIGGIPLGNRVNLFLRGVRSDYLERAALTRSLARFDTDPETKKIRLDSARKLSARAANVPLFPIPTKAQCKSRLDKALAKE